MKTYKLMLESISLNDDPERNSYILTLDLKGDEQHYEQVLILPKKMNLNDVLHQLISLIVDLDILNRQDQDDGC